MAAATSPPCEFAMPAADAGARACRRTSSAHRSRGSPAADRLRLQYAVVDVDRVPVSYNRRESGGALRRMSSTILNSLAHTPLRRQGAAEPLLLGGDGSRTVETFELLHFAAWTPPA